MKVQERYDAFQSEAVNNVIEDFKENAQGRYLLVIPTGGGKTTTAVKAVSALFGEGVLHQDDKVLWVVHRDELKTQAFDSFTRFANETNQPWLPGRVHIEMLGGITKFLSDNPTLRFAVIDEAHHAAANSYLPLFELPNLGILGLTATPSRHDGKPLQFSKESYSIGFPDLVQMGVLIRPKVIRVDGGTYEINDIGVDSESLEIFNNLERNEKIIAALMEHKSQLNKVIIYAGTKNHARDIYKLLKASAYSKNYDAISLILGDERRTFITHAGIETSNETRKDFVLAQKKFVRSILVNVDVLTEGYDDPSVNAVVMARPTNSKLVYMQALGRAVRIDPENEGKEAFVIEVEDTLPNISYRIDNRWLYSDISDLLEPDVTDMQFDSLENLHRSIANIFERFNVPDEYRLIPEISERDRVTVLLFKTFLGAGRYGHIPLVITNATRQAAAAFFNYLADRMNKLIGLDIEKIIKPVLTQMQQFEILNNSSVRKLTVHAMENAWLLIKNGHESSAVPVKSGYPWISFVAFRKQMADNALSEDFVLFTADMQNKETVRESLLTDSISQEFYLLKFPLPLRDTWGVFLPTSEFDGIQYAIQQLREVSSKQENQNQWHAAMTIIGTTTAYVEQRHVQSLTTIVREDIDYFRRVCDCKKRSEN
jgi:superfamily II DNA or RNA helicase